MFQQLISSLTIYCKSMMDGDETIETRARDIALMRHLLSFGREYAQSNEQIALFTAVETRLIERESPKGVKETYVNTPKYPEPTEPEPSESQLEEWVYDSVCDATDGCAVEPDGTCPHGHPSWLLRLGLI